MKIEFGFDTIAAKGRFAAKRMSENFHSFLNPLLLIEV